MTDPLAGAVIAEETGAGRFQIRIQTGDTTIFADEPVAAGGLGSGPNPYDLLCSALAACTTMTIRLYAAQKGWPVGAIRTQVAHRRDPHATPPDLFTRRIVIEGDLDAAQRARLFEIADRCPVHRTLTGGARVETEASATLPDCTPTLTHRADMDALIAVGRGSFDFAEP